MKVNVETEEIQRLRLQKLRWWIIRESAQAFRVDLLGDLDQVVDEVSHRARPAPANNVGRDLVDKTEGKNSRMPRAVQNRLAHRLASFLASSLRVQKAKMLVPGDIDHQPEVMRLRQVQQPDRRNVIDADNVRPQSADLYKIFGGLLRRGKS